MPSKELVDYIIGQYSANVPTEQIKSSLFQAGWDQDVVEEAVGVALGNYINYASRGKADISDIVRNIKPRSSLRRIIKRAVIIFVVFGAFFGLAVLGISAL